MRIKSNYLIVSNYNNDLNWIPKYTNNYFVYDKSDSEKYIKCLNLNKVKRVVNLGYNLSDYFTFIIDNYENLPECVIFAKGNLFPRHVSKKYFERIANNSYFTPIEDYHKHKPEWPTSFFSGDGGYNEINNSWYLHLNGYHPTRYFLDYNDFLLFCFKDPVIPRYIRFAPGGNYIVPRSNILKLPKQFYENLRIFITHDRLAGEAHIVERAMFTLWTCNFEINLKMLKPISPRFKAKLTNSEFTKQPVNISKLNKIASWTIQLKKKLL